MCKFVKIDHAEAWKMSYQQSSDFLRAENDTTHGVFWTNLSNIYIIICSAAFLQRNENAVLVNIAVINCAKKKTITNSN